ncbi:hypothetical protein BX600DRAFT_55668 [Xylariales sp. PMI_506]|nr:hypothetical protein BX600DRAFT_55668 [Xylariales sp. PMI_506]
MSSVIRRACDTCTRRKVKCDKQNPCANCSKALKECTYGTPVSSQRHRKRVAEGDLWSRINEYEQLMRKHNIKFNPLDTSWIPSPLEEKLASVPSPQILSPRGDPDVHLPSPVRLEAQEFEKQDTANLQSYQLQGEAARYWFGLPKELREPAIDRIRWPGNTLKDGPPEAGWRSIAPPLVPIQVSMAPKLLELHPEPKQIFKLWQLFASNVDPVTKIVHVPTLQLRITDIIWNLEAVTKSLEALMFAIYALVITSIKQAECMEIFGESRAALLSRYRSGAAQALAAADMHFTRDLEVLQALVLFILLEPRSELSLTLISVAARIGHKMGLHRTGAAASQMSFFEQEMRLRLWWQIRALESRARRILGLPKGRADFGGVRLPLNVNDAELHPRMTSRPAVEHNGATEMIYCLSKAEILHWSYSSPTLEGHFVVTPLELARSTKEDDMITKRKAYEELRECLEERLRHCDPSIPLHHVTASAGRLFLHAKRFWCFQPRHQPDEGRHMSPLEQDEVFESSVRIFELGLELRDTQFPKHLVEYMSSRTHIDAFVYMLSELQWRTTGALVGTAWALVEKMWRDYLEPFLHEESPFYSKLADLTLESWSERQKGLAEAHEQDTAPEFIRMLQAARGNPSRPGVAGITAGSLADVVFPMELDETLDWTNWNEFLEL